MDSTILGPVLAAIMGSLFTWILAYGTEYYRFNNKKKGIYVILNSEVDNNIFSLKRFEIYHPVKNSFDIRDEWTISDLQNYYKTLNDFPILKHGNWDEFIDVVPDIFDEFDIRKIIECNSNMDKINDLVRFLSTNYKINYALDQDNLRLNEIPYDDYRKMAENYRTFENNYNDLLKNLDNIKKVFDDKRLNLSYPFDLTLFASIILEIIIILIFSILLKLK